MSSLDTSTLKTTLEEDFVSPLTAVRGSLEILRDFPDLAPRQRQRFVESALEECARLERGIEGLADAVYASARKGPSAPEGEVPETTPRVAFQEGDVAEIDMQDVEFTSSEMVDHFFDDIEQLVKATGQKWYFLTNFTACRVWPEAWVAFAHRGKRIAVNFGLGSVRYEEPETTREAALAQIAEMRLGG